LVTREDRGFGDQGSKKTKLVFALGEKSEETLETGGVTLARMQGDEKRAGEKMRGQGKTRRMEDSERWGVQASGPKEGDLGEEIQGEEINGYGHHEIARGTETWAVAILRARGKIQNKRGGNT